MNRIADNLSSVQQRIAVAAEKAGRDPAEITLVAVTKTVGLDEICALYDLGVRDFGENRVEVALEKITALADMNDINWHFIGHLQRNKAKKVVGKVAAIHSVESAGLLKIIENAEAITEVFLEVNISGEESKYGLVPTDVSRLLEEYGEKVKVVGLMTMAPFYADPEATRGVFAGLKSLRDELVAETGQELPYLSMGMSNDFEVAVQEGATHVRVGSELFK